MRNVTKTTVMTIALTPDQWELFTSSMDCTDAATALNEQFNVLSKAGALRDDFEEAMHKVMSKYSDFGASDSEPYWMLEKLLDEQFA